MTIECDFKKMVLQDVIKVIQERSEGLQEFSINQGPQEIYNSEEPVEKLLQKTIGEFCQSY